MTELSPLDVLGKKFTRRVSGYDASEVHEFLTQVAGSMESSLRERAELKQRLHRLEQELADFRDREAALHEALVAAQRSAESTVESARTEAQKIVEEGHGLADRLIDEANARAKTIETVISDLRQRRREVRAELIRLVELMQGIVSDDKEREKEERATPQLALLTRHRDGTAEHNG